MKFYGKMYYVVEYWKKVKRMKKNRADQFITNQEVE